jgi:hypothetical protein
LFWRVADDLDPAIHLLETVDLSSHQVERKSWNPCGLAAILWRSDRFAILVFFASILVGAADVEGGALSWAAAWRAGGCCGMSGTDVGTATPCTRVSMSRRGGPTLSERIRMIGLVTSLWSVVSGSVKWDDTTNSSARSAPPTKVK